MLICKQRGLGRLEAVSSEASIGARPVKGVVDYGVTGTNIHRQLFVIVVMDKLTLLSSP